MIFAILGREKKMDFLNVEVSVLGLGDKLQLNALRLL